MDEQNTTAERLPDTPKKKAPYSPPRLRVEGPIEKLTQNVGTEPTDLLTGGSRLV